MAQTFIVTSRGYLSTNRMVKAENDVITVNVDFGLFFDTDTASTATVTTDSGLTASTPSVATNIVSFELSSGDSGTVYDVTVKLAGTTETKEVIIQCKVIDLDTVNSTDYWFGWYN